VSSIIYHGDKVARAEIRRKFLPKTVGPDFPIVVTSYEMAMSDARFLAHYKWKYVVVDEVMGKPILQIIVFVLLLPCLVFTYLFHFSPGTQVEKF
jgi:hypothetical protein